MEVAASALMGELVNRFISFLMNKYINHASLEMKAERLHQLLLRVHTVVEEADGRYITNGAMLVQLKMLAETMYRGYHVLDTFKYQRLKEGAEQEVSDSSSLSFATTLKRSRTTSTATKNKAVNHELHSTLENLEVVVANMREFSIYFGGYERMFRKPYDTYLYVDNFMFGRHTEKQQITNFLLQENPLGAPAVLPVIGGHGVGKKTLVTHICNDERIRSCFSSILHFNGDNFWTFDAERHRSERTLVIVAFHSNANDEDWTKFYLSLTCLGRGSKVIITSRLLKISRHGTVKPFILNRLTDEEFQYLFKALAFGSANPVDHPQLVSIAKEFEFGGSLVGTYMIADVLRKNMNLELWLSILKMARDIVDRNFTMYGAAHPKLLFEREHPVDITNAAISPAGPLRLLSNVSKIKLPKVTFGELVADPTIRPKGEFNLVFWESRIPPYTTSVHYVPTCADDKPETSMSRGRKRPGLII